MHCKLLDGLGIPCHQLPPTLLPSQKILMTKSKLMMFWLNKEPCVQSPKYQCDDSDSRVRLNGSKRHLKRTRKWQKRHMIICLNCCLSAIVELERHVCCSDSQMMLSTLHSYQQLVRNVFPYSHFRPSLQDCGTPRTTRMHALSLKFLSALRLRCHHRNPEVFGI